MTTPSKIVEAARQSLVDQIAAISTMQPGTLAEEWRERPNPEGIGVLRLGPYYKHQVWKDGRNVSRRVPAAEAALLREDIDNAKRFEQLTQELAHLNIEHTLALRRGAERAKLADHHHHPLPRQLPCGDVCPAVVA